MWVGVFALWLVLLSGVFALGETGFAPGAIQALRLNALLESRRDQVNTMQNDLDRLSTEADSLEHSHVAQYREIRKVLGYAANDELIFDFSAPDSI